MNNSNEKRMYFIKVLFNIFNFHPTISMCIILIGLRPSQFLDNLFASNSVYKYYIKYGDAKTINEGCYNFIFLYCSHTSWYCPRGDAQRSITIIPYSMVTNIQLFKKHSSLNCYIFHHPCYLCKQDMLTSREWGLEL